MTRLADQTADREFVVSNEDFRFANFIEIDSQRTGLVDWDGARTSRHEVEHCIAYLWLQMWRNGTWQRRLVDRSRQILDLQEDLFRAALIKRTLCRAHTWHDNADLRKIQIQYFRDALNNQKWHHIWES